MSANKLYTAFQQNKWLHITLMVALPVLIYVQSINFEYTNFDDNGIILQKIDVIKNIKNIDTAFKVDAFFNAKGDFYRPIQNITFMLDAQVSGEKLLMFHITNLLIHIFTSIALYFLLQFLGGSRYASFLIAFLFSVHPLFASGVGWIPSRGDILIGLLGILLFLTFGFYYRYKKVYWFLLHTIFFAITIFTKETTVLFPFFFVYYYLLIMQPFNKSRLLKRLLALWPFVVSWLGIFIVYFILRKAVVTGTGATADVLGIIPFFKNNTVIPTIIGQFFIPFNLSTLPLYSNAATITGIVFLLLIVYITFSASIQKKWTALMGLLWFILFVLPPTIYRLENADTFFNYLEHRTYLPMIGIAIVLVFALQTALQHKKISQYFLWIYFPVVIVFSIMAYAHCADYKNNFTLASKAALRNNPAGFSMRAGGYLDKKDTANALADISKAIAMSPKDAGMYFTRGKILAKMQKHEEAERDFTQALSLNANLVDVLMARSVERRILKKYEGAFRDIYSASRLDSLNPKIYFSFGNLFVATENYIEAVNSFTKAISLKSDYAEAYNNRSFAHYNNKNYIWAINDADTAIKYMPQNAFVYNNKGRALAALSKLDEALQNFNKAIELNNNFGQAYFEKALVLLVQQDKQNACTNFTKAVQLNYPEAKEKALQVCK